jgi:phenylacetate-CoA ligase
VTMDPRAAETDPVIRRVSLPRRALLTGTAVVSQWRERRMPYSSPEVIERWQRRRLRRMIEHAYLHVPYYRETMRKLGLTPGDLTGARDLDKLPLVEREQLQRDPERFISENRSASDCVTRRSGGSTRMPVSVLEDPWDLIGKAASKARIQPMVVRLSGRRWRRRVAQIGPPASSGTRFRRAYDRNLIRPFDPRTVTMNLSMQRTVAENLAAINEFRPHVISTFGSYVEELFAHAVRSGQPFHRPNLVGFAADHLSPGARELISGELGIPVLSVYQAIESPQIGFECERHTGYHLNVDICPVRIVDGDGRDVPPGESGEVVISNLVNRTTVLLNYGIGDVATLMAEPCGCGRTLPLLSFIQGRTDEWAIGLDGRRLHTQLLVRPFSLDPEIWGYRVEQRGDGHFAAQVLAARGADHASVAARVKDRFARMVGPEETVTISFVDALPRTRGAKVKRMVALRAQDESASKDRDIRAEDVASGS